MYICSMIKKWILIVLAAAAFTLAADPVTVEARLTEIPGKMPSNDLYSYVYVFKYKVQKVVSGKLDAKEILVGAYAWFAYRAWNEPMGFWGLYPQP